MTGAKPMPDPSPVSRVFWEKAAAGELWLQQCQDCQKFIFYPRAICPHCLSINLAWTPSKGRGRVYTFTVVYRSDLPGFETELPYICAIVELEEGPRMSSNIINCPVGEVRIDMPVEVVFEKITPEISLPKFQPRKTV